jgi:hypothetical protein
MSVFNEPTKLMEKVVIPIGIATGLGAAAIGVASLPEEPRQRQRVAAPARPGSTKTTSPLAGCPSW